MTNSEVNDKRVRMKENAKDIAALVVLAFIVAALILAGSRFSRKVRNDCSRRTGSAAVSAGVYAGYASGFSSVK